MIELLKDIDLILLLIIFGSGILAFSLSTISGGGGALLLIPIVKFFIEATIGTLIGKKLLSRMSNIIFRKFVIVIMVISGILLLIKAVSSL